MKTFKQLTLGDFFYKAVITFEKLLDSPAITPFEVFSLKISDDKTKLLINGKYNDYHREWFYDLKININEASEKSALENPKDFIGFWFTEIDLANNYVKQLVLDRIKNHKLQLLKQSVIMNIQSGCCVINTLRY